jgi:hypothetical protein
VKYVNLRKGGGVLGTGHIRFHSQGIYQNRKILLNHESIVIKNSVLTKQLDCNGNLTDLFSI